MQRDTLAAAAARLWTGLSPAERTLLIVFAAVLSLFQLLRHRWIEKSKRTCKPAAVHSQSALCMFGSLHAFVFFFLGWARTDETGRVPAALACDPSAQGFWKGFTWKTFVYPFHKELLLGSFGINVFIGIVVTIMPVYHTVHMLVSHLQKYARRSTNSFHFSGRTFCVHSHR